MRAAIGLAIALATIGCGSRAARPTVEAAPAATGTTGASGVSSATIVADACRGHDLVLEAAMEHCRIDVATLPAPAASELVASLEPQSVRSGETARVWITFRNAAAHPLDVFFPHWIGLHESIWSGEVRVDERTEPPQMGILGGLASCDGECRPIHVMIEPGGTLRAYVDVPARVTILREPAHAEGEIAALEEVDGGPIAPGTYELVVFLPWSDPDENGTHIGREIRSTITVTP